MSAVANYEMIVPPARRGSGAARVVARVLALVLALCAHAVAAVPAHAGAGRVVIDAGHGGKDPGASSPFLRLHEKDVTLKFARLVGAALERRGIAVTYTRTDDRYVTLDERAALARRVGASALLSLHLNAAPNPNAAGAEIWYGPHDDSIGFAAAVLGAVSSPLDAHGIAVRGTRAGTQMAVLRGGVPAALLELGYITNARDAAALQRDSLLAAAAEAAARGIEGFLKGQREGPVQVMRATAGLSGLYFVQPGDTLRTIATRLGLPGDEIARLNPATLAQSLLVGQPLQVPGPKAADRSGPPAAAPASGRGPAPVAAPSLKGVATYTVRRGDTLYSIAARSGQPVAQLAELNRLSDPGVLIEGQRLSLAATSSAPGPGATAAGAGGRRYVVRPGETLSEIALRLGVEQEALVKGNGLADPDYVRAGTVLNVPAPRA